MSTDQRIETLRERHATLETQIESESSRPQPDLDAVSEWKREKLRIKDQISTLEHH